MEPTKVAPGVFRFEKVAPSGWCWNMLVVTLPDGGTLVHSPTWLGEGTFEALEKLGTPRVLFAPNNYHHLGLPRFRERYPDALPVASARALPRLERQGHRDLSELDAALPRLQPGARFVSCEGAKSGEAWLLLPGEPGPTLMVCDAFFDIKRETTGLMGFALRTLKVVPGLRVSRTYRYLALDDRRRYLEWATQTIEQARPHRLLVSHGESIEDAELTNYLVSAMNEML